MGTKEAEAEYLQQRTGRETFGTKDAGEDIWHKGRGEGGYLAKRTHRADIWHKGRGEGVSGTKDAERGYLQKRPRGGELITKDADGGVWVQIWGGRIFVNQASPLAEII